jgi:hypothetical protein
MPASWAVFSVRKEDLMFASWSKARGASLAMAGAAALGALIAVPAHALEGVQGRHAIFYPSLELVYQHDDNYFLEPDNEHSADTFIAHAHFALEIPGARQYLRLEYSPQYRNVDVNNGPRLNDLEELSHFWDLDAKLKGSSIFGVDIHHNFTRGALETYELDRSSGEPGSVGREFVKGGHEPFIRNNIDVDFKWDGSRQGARVMVGKEDTNFDDADQAPDWFELDEWRLGFEYHYKFTPLSKFLVGYEYAAATQDFVGIQNPFSLDSSRNRLWFGFDGELGRTTTGAARVGYVSIDFDQAPNAAQFTQDPDWEGLQLRANVTKSFSRFTKLAFGAERSPYYSSYLGLVDDVITTTARNGYYVGNQVFFNLTNQPQGGRVFWALIGQAQRNSYDVETADAGSGDNKEREDDVLRIRGEVGFHPIEHLSFRLNYQHEERDSSHYQFNYDDNIVAVQVQFGF